MKIFPINVNYIKQAGFKGISENISMFSYDQDFDETLKDGEYKMPVRSIYLSDINKEIDEFKQVTDIPAEEYLSDNINQIVKQSSHYRPNSSIEKIKSLHEDKEKIIQKIKNQKFEKQTGKSTYKGKIYFSDMDEMPDSTIRQEHNIIIHDKKPAPLNYYDLRNKYVTKNKIAYDPKLQNQKRLFAIIDYYSRKLEANSDKEKIAANCQKEINLANVILKSVEKIDKLLLEKKTMMTQNNKEKIQQIDFLVSDILNDLIEYYTDNLPNNIKANFNGTRYV